MKKILLSILVMFGAVTASAMDDVQMAVEMDSVAIDFETYIEADSVPPTVIEDNKIDNKKVVDTKNLPNNIVINKRQRQLQVITPTGKVLGTYPICASRNMGQKVKSGDCRTPEGIFGVSGIYPSSTWRYKGTGSRCYGPWFIRMRIPGNSSIGVHGTNNPSSVPGRHSHGCVRMHNEDITKVKGMITTKSRIIVLSDDPATEKRQLEELHASFSNPAPYLSQPDRFARSGGSSATTSKATNNGKKQVKKVYKKRRR